ncbi:hypothetical protein [uncultured Fibrella sp.]|uniref:hypothetical protein n=1 Tax=uncultured Fibrella sp. TaxID=1284596 RepID=UPI0035CA30B3
MADSIPVQFADAERIAQLLNAYIQKAENAFQRRISSQGLVLTGEMLNSFRQYAAERGEGYVEAKLGMVGYLRMKDLKSLNYSRTPPLRALMDFVEKVGVDKFAYVPGYPQGVKPATEAKAIERIAWGIKMNMQRHPNVKRGYRGIYADPLLSEVLPNFFRDLTDDSNRTAMLGVKQLFSQF